MATRSTSRFAGRLLGRIADPEVALVALVWAVFLTGLAAAAPPDAAAIDLPELRGLDAEEQRLAVWNSQEMLAARAWLEDYFRASRRYDRRRAAEYLRRLSRLEPAEMRLWLARLERARRRAAERQLALETQRQFDLARAAAVRQQRAANLARAAEVEAVRARLAQQRLSAERQQTQALVRQRAASRDETLRRQFTDDRTFALLNFLDRQELQRDILALRAQLEGDRP